MTLEILICTFGSGINNIKDVVLPPQPNIKYLVSWQATQDNIHIPIELIRPDITVSKINSIGLSANRNNALSLCSGDICLIADDDVRYNINELEKLIEVTELHPSVDIFTFRYNNKNGNSKDYPSFAFDLRHMPRNYYVTSFEIAFRRKSICGKISFNELFGLGAPELGAGEENVFIMDALKANLHCMFFPIVIVNHDHPTTTFKHGGEQRILMSKGAIIRIAHPHTYIPRIIVNSHRLRNQNVSGFWHALIQMIKGAAYAKQNNLL